MRRLSLALAVLAAVTRPGETQEVGVTQTEILIGSCADLLGSQKTVSIQQLEGAKAYFAHINANGGVYSRQLKLLSYDDGSDLKQAVACFKKLQDQGVFAGAFFVGAPPASRYAPMAEYNRIPVLGFLSGASFLYEPVKHYVFAIHPSHRDTLQSAIDSVWNELGIRRVAVLHEDNAFGKGVVDGTERALRKRDTAPAEIVSFSPKNRDFGAAVGRLKAADAQMVIIAGSGAMVMDTIRKSKESGWSPLFVSVANDPAMLEGGKPLEGTLIMEGFPSPAQTELPTIALYDQLLKKYSKGTVPSFAGVEGFIDAMVLVEGLKRAGRSLTRDKFVDALESIQSYDLGLGAGYKIGYSPENHQGVGAFSPTVIRAGKEVPLDWRSLKSAQGRTP